MFRTKLPAALGLAVASAMLAIAPGGTVPAAHADGSVAASAAATGSVSLRTITTKTAPYRGKATVKPSYATSGRVSVDAALLTVKKGRTYSARNKPSAALAAGSYTVTQTLRYRPYSLRTVQKTVRSAGATITAEDSMWQFDCTLSAYSSAAETGTVGCTVVSATTGEQWKVSYPVTREEDYARSPQLVDAYVYSWGEWIVGTEVYPSAIVLPKALTRATTQKVYGSSRTVRKSQKLTVKAGAKPRTCATAADFNKVAADFDEPSIYGDSKSRVTALLHNAGTRTSYSVYDTQVLEFRSYRACTKNTYISVGFENGYAYFKSYDRY